MKRNLYRCILVLLLCHYASCTELESGETSAENSHEAQVPVAQEQEAPQVQEPITQENQLVNATLEKNVTTENASVVAVPAKRFTCILNESAVEATVKLLNASMLQGELVSDASITNRSHPAICQMVFFYAPWCPFSIKAAPHLNALPKHFPGLQFYGINAYKHISLNSMYGVMAVPALFLFHNGKPAARYNDTEYKIEQISAFITQYTGVEPNGPLVRTSADYKGPLPTSLSEETDPWLIAAWIFVLLSAVYWFTKSSWFSTIVENLQNTWREAAAQHEHTD